MASRMAWTAVFLVLSSVLVLGGLVAVSDQEVDFEAESRADELNTTRIRAAVHDRVNEVRVTHGVDKLPYDEQTEQTAQNHSEWMVQEGNYTHSNNEIYQCRRSENIAKVSAYGELYLDSGRLIDLRGNETTIGTALVDFWMDSPPHRKNILRPENVAHGVGIAVTGESGPVEVYATQAFCVADLT